MDIFKELYTFYCVNQSAALAAIFCPNLTRAQESSNRTQPEPDKHSGFYVRTWAEPDVVNLAYWSNEFVPVMLLLLTWLQLVCILWLHMLLLDRQKVFFYV